MEPNLTIAITTAGITTVLPLVVLLKFLEAMKNVRHLAKERRDVEEEANKEENKSRRRRMLATYWAVAFLTVIGLAGDVVLYGYEFSNRMAGGEHVAPQEHAPNPTHESESRAGRPVKPSDDNDFRCCEPRGLVIA